MYKSVARQARQSAWICESCLSRTNTFVRSYAYARTKSGSGNSKPANQSLSAKVAQSTPGAGQRRPSHRPETVGEKMHRPFVVKREPKKSQGRMSKTGTSVLTSVPIHERTAGKSSSDSVENFDSLRLLPAVSEAILTGALKSLDYATPSLIQSLSIPAMLAGPKSKPFTSYLVAAETGSGKTLAYLAPVIQLLKIAEQAAPTERQTGLPRCIILLPSKELVMQVGSVVKAMSYKARTSSSILLPSYSFRRSKNQVLAGPVDILVTMPHQLQMLLEEDFLSLDRTRHFIVDEADTLLDTSFSETVLPLIGKAKNLDSLIFCSATIPRSMDSYLRKNYPNIERIVSPKIHSIPRRISTKFIDVEKEFNGNKNVAVHQILRDLSTDSTEPGKVKKVILFVNRRESVDEVAEYLISKGVAALPFWRDSENRDQNLSHFLTDTDITPDAPESLKVLVTTDLASRGIDTTPVKNVIIYDTPHSTIDLLHRIGRTGRAGRRGTAYIMTTNKRGEAWLRDVKHLSISGQPLI